MDQTAIMALFLPCMGTIVFCALLFGFIALLRWFRHREIMAQARQGLPPQDEARPRARKSTLLLGSGLMLAAVGLALMIGLYPAGFASADPYPLHFGPWMLFGLVPLFVGLALLITRQLTLQNGGSREPVEPKSEEEE